MSDIEKQAGAIGLEITDSGMSAVFVDNHGEPSPAGKGPVSPDEDRLEQAASFVKSLVASMSEVSSVGVALPGLVDVGSGKVAFSAATPQHEDLDFAGHLKKASGLPVLVENDANAAAFAEHRIGAGKGADNLFYATIGRGVGGALILDGAIWRGVSGYSGEFGHIAIDPDGSNLESVASVENIVRRTRGRFHQDHTSSLNSLAEEEITMTDIVNAASKGDDFAGMMLKRTGYYIGTAVASVINLLNLGRIVIGGEIMQGGPLVLESIIQRAKELSFEPSFAATEIRAAELGETAAATGAALLASGTFGAAHKA